MEQVIHIEKPCKDCGSLVGFLITAKDRKAIQATTLTIDDLYPNNMPLCQWCHEHRWPTHELSVGAWVAIG